mmetsp:Transcript_11079/g.16128  ORF Transcript_11079/g.16128 Transcript_11079/m.16128 type:complete len:242 (+) Transcript_11079:265-990(+)|eukprot:CAMPEP_0197243924 /NCGR_PEP_ID=MMETSP1429-20130617/9195_1 /TAXON_ID=49237 /ORGANISM="Chaetoceros  sp., Strain UNC1202" /LENGTH=241 /DNA_ID=CAMNT_0042704213 /DNA_START=604 /DNA_END=1329 /DNA_ORIENTATION=+
MGGVWAPKVNAGPHKKRECLPIAVILRDKLKYALTGKECQQICMERCVKVDGKVRTDQKFPAGFMDVIELEKSGDIFRLLFDIKGRFVLHRVSKDEGAYKLCKVKKTFISSNKIPVCVTHDGRTIRYPDPDVKSNDTIKIDIATGKMGEIIKFGVGSMVMITSGNNCGRIGQLMHIEKHEGSFNIATVQDTKGNSFCTRLNNVFAIGSGNVPEITLPKGRGIKKDIIQERTEAVARGDLDM